MKQAKVYDNELDRDQQDVEDLRDLQDHPGWRILLEEIDREIQQVEKVLVGDVGKPNDLEQIEGLQGHRKDLRFLKQLPEEIIKKIKGSQSGSRLSRLDPYE